MSKVLVGTSGWMYDDWKGIFYPENLPQNKWLEFYSQNFETVEVNSTFYHQMKPETFANWGKIVPKNFVFSVKASRFITHIKRLLNCEEPLKRLLEQVKGLGANLGPVLFQLPPRWKADEKRLESFLSTASRLQTTAKSDLATAVDSSQPSSRAQAEGKAVVKLVFEFRDESWFIVPIFKILHKYNVGLVINDSPHFPKTEEIAANFTYIRFHGPSALYSSEYSEKELQVWAEKIKQWEKSGILVFGYFNNDVSGFAVKNAKTLINLIESLKS